MEDKRHLFSFVDEHIEIDGITPFYATKETLQPVKDEAFWKSEVDKFQYHEN